MTHGWLWEESLLRKLEETEIQTARGGGEERPPVHRCPEHVPSYCLDFPSSSEVPQAAEPFGYYIESV